MATSSAFARRRQLGELIAAGELGTNVLELLLPEGKPIEYERDLWDYKLNFPDPNPGDHTGEDRDFRCGRLIKHVVAFYNSFGGYLLAGIRDDPREPVGFEGAFDCDELNRMVKASTRHSIECHFRSVPSPWHKDKIFGLLFVPRRADHREPAQFVREGPKSLTGRASYQKGKIYFRDADQSRPAETSDDFMFLCAPSRRCIDTSSYHHRVSILDHNLPPRDPEFIKFLGREPDLEALWRWLCDEFSPVRLIAGLGGVGKTTLAREFVEDVRRCSPMGFEKVIWLSAKKKYFTATAGRLVSTPRVDFQNVDEMLRALLCELGTPDEEIDASCSRLELQSEIEHSLTLIPSLVVLDDIDSLAPEEQREAFHTCLEVMNRVIGRATPPSRAILTARLELGAAPGQLMKIAGLPYEAFCDYVELMSDHLGLEWNLGRDSKSVRKFHRTTEGSPLFTNSILRLLNLGDRLETALARWKAHAGIDVRKFAFIKELQELSGSQLRTLYALCCLGESSFVELQDVTESTEGLLQDDLSGLMNYHLIAKAGSIPVGGPKLSVPDSIRLMADIIQERLLDPRRIEKRCKQATTSIAGQERQVGGLIRKVASLWNIEENGKALEVAQYATGKYNHPDLHCLLGRALLTVDPPKAKRADTAFRKAFELGCRRKELPDLWVEAKKALKDWVGVTEVVRSLPDDLLGADHVYEFGLAQIRLADNAAAQHKREVASERYRQAGISIDKAFKEDMARGRVEDLKKLRWLAFTKYVELMAILRPEPDEHLDVWLAALDAFDCYVRASDVLRLGVSKLESWWGSVERRGQGDHKAARLLEVQLDRLDGVIGTVSSESEPRPNLLSYLENRRDKLRTQLGEYYELLLAW